MRVLIGIGILLLVLWVVLWIGLRIVGGLVHILVIAGAVFLIWGIARSALRR